MSFNIKVPFVISTHLKKFSATSGLKNKNKATAFGTVNNVPYFHDGTAARKFLFSSPVVSLAAATLTLSAALHDGLFVVVNILSGATITLPAATGSGANFRIFVGTALTSGSLVLQVANASDFMRGFAYVKTDDSATSSNTYATANTGTVATESDTLTWNRTTTGTAVIGDFISVEDIATNVWAVETENNASGAEATPFSAAV